MSKHMDLNDRNQIYIGLEAGKSFGEISRELGKARSTIAREVKHHRIVWKKGAVGRVKNQCIHRSNCKLFDICENKPDCTRKCSTCSHCNKICHDFLEERCPKLEMPPYVCNGCSGIHVCTLNKVTAKYPHVYEFASLHAKIKTGSANSENSENHATETEPFKRLQRR